MMIADQVAIAPCTDPIQEAPRILKQHWRVAERNSCAVDSDGANC